MGLTEKHPQIKWLKALDLPWLFRDPPAFEYRIHHTAPWESCSLGSAVVSRPLERGFHLRTAWLISWIQWIGKKGKCTGKARFSHEIWGFPVNVPLDQSIDGYPSLTPKHYKSLWIQVPSEGVPREKTWICQHEIRVCMKTKGKSLEIGWLYKFISFHPTRSRTWGTRYTLFSDPWRNVTR